METVPLEENELVLKAQKGDERAFEELVYRYDSRILGIAMRYTGDRETARDIYQEVLLRVHAALPRFRFESRFSTWIYRIAANLCLTYRATERRNRTVPLEEEESGDGRRRGKAVNPPEALIDASDSLRQTFSSEIAARLGEALDQLSPQQRMVFVLRHFEGQKLREIADCLDCAEGTVKKHLFTGTQRLRQQLQEFV
jgi:RNA polymerase sigma-70 factor, ECF subfamily